MGCFVLAALILEGFSVDSFAMPYWWVSLGLAASSIYASGGEAESRKNNGPMNEQESGLRNIFLFVFCCGLVILCIFTSLMVRLFSQVSRTQAVESPPVVTAATETATPEKEEKQEATPTPAALESKEEEIPGEETLKILESNEVPENDPFDLAERFNGITNPSIQLEGKPAVYKNGAEKKFWVLEVDKNYYRQVTAKLVYQTPHLYFWAEEGVDYDVKAVAQLCDTFEDHIYPTDREYFGSEWTPGRG